jgi:hypothetical protein
MTDAPTNSIDSPIASGWSHRILIAAIAGIFFLTLYPFRFSVARHWAGSVFPYVLASRGKDAGLLDAFLNVLLFVPFGFGLAESLRDRGKSWVATLGLTLAAGALLSYSIEFVQAYTPFRDSGWEDILTNSAGAVVGVLFFELCGRSVLRTLSAGERALATFLTLPRAAVVLFAYFAVWFAISIPLQKESQMTNWSPDALLVVGNAASGRLGSAWKGEILRLQIWDRALPRKSIQGLASRGSSKIVEPVPLAEYEFSGLSPFRDERHFLPDLSWTPSAPILSAPEGTVLDGKSWLVSHGSVSALVKDFQRTQQFSVRIVCKPAEVDGGTGRIVSISRIPEPVNLEVRQDDSTLVFWLRSPLSIKRFKLAWRISNVFTNTHPRDILFSYDGSNLSLYVDGKEERAYRLGPGTVLAQLIRRIKPSELEGYHYIFYALVFLPAGCLLGLAWRNLVAQPISRYLFIVFGILPPALMLEIILVRSTGSAISLGNVVLGSLLGLAGSLWINAESGAFSRLTDSSTLKFGN